MIGSRKQHGRGSTMIEGALAVLVFAVMVAGIMELGLVGLASNSVSFAALRAARFAAVRGATSGHPATVADIQAVATEYAAPLSSGSLTVGVTWTPNNQIGGTVQVTVAYAFRPALLPVSADALNLSSTSRQAITQ